MKTILLVDDNPQDLELTLMALEKVQLADEVITLRDGAEALDCLFRRGAHHDRALGDPAVILLDVNLPKVDGMEVLEQLKADTVLRSIPIVMFSSSREEKAVGRCYDLGANAYVVKPIGFRQFIKAIGDVATFWALLNEPPAGSVRPLLRPASIPDSSSRVT